MEFYVIFLSCIGGAVLCSLVLAALIQGCRKKHEEIAPLSEKPKKARQATFDQAATQYNEDDFRDKPIPPKRKIKIKVNKTGGFYSSSSHALPPLKHYK